MKKLYEFNPDWICDCKKTQEFIREFIKEYQEEMEKKDKVIGAVGEWIEDQRCSDWTSACENLKNKYEAIK